MAKELEKWDSSIGTFSIRRRQADDPQTVQGPDHRAGGLQQWLPLGSGNFVLEYSDDSVWPPSSRVPRPISAHKTKASARKAAGVFYHDRRTRAFPSSRKEVPLGVWGETPAQWKDRYDAMAAKRQEKVDKLLLECKLTWTDRGDPGTESFTAEAQGAPVGPTTLGGTDYMIGWQPAWPSLGRKAGYDLVYARPPLDSSRRAAIREGADAIPQEEMLGADGRELPEQPQPMATLRSAKAAAAKHCRRVSGRGRSSGKLAARKTEPSAGAPPEGARGGVELLRQAETGDVWNVKTPSRDWHYVWVPRKFRGRTITLYPISVSQLNDMRATRKRGLKWKLAPLPVPEKVAAAEIEGGTVYIRPVISAASGRYHRYMSAKRDEKRDSEHRQGAASARARGEIDASTLLREIAKLPNGYVFPVPATTNRGRAHTVSISVQERRDAPKEFRGQRLVSVDGTPARWYAETILGGSEVPRSLSIDFGQDWSWTNPREVFASLILGATPGVPRTKSKKVSARTAKPKEFSAHGRGTVHVAGGGSVTGTSREGTSGLANYWPGAPADVQRELKRVFREFPGSVVLDGSDDWHSWGYERPGEYRGHFKVKPLASFHSGMSGVSKSGIVVTVADFNKIRRGFPKVWWRRHPMGGGRREEKEGVKLYDTKVRIYTDPNAAPTKPKKSAAGKSKPVTTTSSSGLSLTREASYFARDSGGSWRIVAQAGAGGSITPAAAKLVESIYRSPKGHYSKVKLRRRDVELQVMVAFPPAYKLSDVRGGGGIALWDWAAGPRTCPQVERAIEEYVADDLAKVRVGLRKDTPAYVTMFLEMGRRLCGASNGSAKKRLKVGDAATDPTRFTPGLVIARLGFLPGDTTYKILKMLPDGSASVLELRKNGTWQKTPKKLDDIWLSIAFPKQGYKVIRDPDPEKAGASPAPRKTRAKPTAKKKKVRAEAELTPAARAELLELYQASEEAEENPGGQFPMLDYYKGTPNWDAANLLLEKRYAMSMGGAGDLVLEITTKGREAHEARRPLTKLQLEAVRAYAKWAGRDWKSRLKRDWAQGQSRMARPDGSFDGRFATVLSLRGLRGKAWLDAFKLPPP